MRCIHMHWGRQKQPEDVEKTVHGKDNGGHGGILETLAKRIAAEGRNVLASMCWSASHRGV